MNKLFIIILLSISQQCFSQIKLTGQILDHQNNPLANANISTVGLIASDITDETGVFFITLPTSVKKGDVVTLHISREGYKTINKHIAVTSLSIPIKLEKAQHGQKALKLHNSPLAPSTTPETIQTNENNQPQNQSAPVTSYFQSGGITANQVNIAPAARKLDNIGSNQLLQLCPDKNEKISVTCILGDAEGFQYATQIVGFLKSNGYTKIDGVSQAVFNMPVMGQSISRDTTGAKIIIGVQQ